jgi:hypothetical protein
MGRLVSCARIAGFVVVFALAVAVPALAATSKPDAHDRALALQLNQKVSTFRAIAGHIGGADTSLNKCAYLKRHPKQAFAAAFALVPALLADVVNAYKPEIVSLQGTIAGMHPDSPLFAQWLTAVGGDFKLILSFDNHGKKIDLCRAAVVMLDKIFTNPSASKLSKLNPKMEPFFVQAGLSAKDAKTLTS